jgi:secondary thiamine-phosphate synthase enzyme
VQRLTVETSRREQFVDITGDIRRAVADLQVDEGAVLVYSPHTTAGIVVNEGYDPDVAGDVQGWLRDRIPYRGGYAHAEGNSDSHIKAILVGCAHPIAVEGGLPALGRWQRVFLCEFDGPRTREVWVTPLRA